MTPNDLKKLAAQKKTELRSVLAAAADRDLTADEEARCNALSAEIEAAERRAAALERADNLQRETAAGRVGDPLPHDEAAPGEYSLLRAIGEFLDRGAVSGLEGETSAEIAKRAGKSPQGFYVPHTLPMDPRHAVRMGRRGLEVRTSTLDATAGAGAIFTAPYGTIIEALRAKALLPMVGAQILSDVQGKFAIPKQTAVATFAWYAEGAAATGSNLTIPDSVAFAPNTLSGWTDLTRSFIKQSSYDVEAFARNDLMKGAALALDKAGFAGSGSGAEPLGVINDTSTGLVALGTDGAAPTWSAMVDLETLVADANADAGSLAYVTNAKVRGKLKKTLVDANVLGVYIWGFTGAGGTVTDQVNGYPAHVSTAIPKTLTKGNGSNLSAAAFGNWEDLVVALWGGFDLLPNPYTNATAGSIRLHIYQDADVAIRRSESFARIVDIVTT